MQYCQPYQSKSEEWHINVGLACLQEPIELQPMDNRRREDGHYISSQAQPQSPAQPITVGAEGKPMQELPNGLATHMVCLQPPM